MSRNILRTTALVLTLTLCAFSARGQEVVRRAEHVFIISLDGGKPEVMFKSEMPTLMAKAGGGAVNWEAQTVLPSITLVAHASMLTGVGPAKHHVNWNDWNPGRGLVAVPTVFALADKQGLSTALFAAKEKFNHLNTPGAVKGFAVLGASAPKVARVVGVYIEEMKPNLCFIHFADPDSAGHRHGWGSPEQMQAFANSDAGIRTLVEAIDSAGITEESVVIVSADHGGHGLTHGTNTAADMTIPWIVWGKGVKKGFKITTPVTTYDTAATALWLLNVPIPAGWDGKPVMSAFEDPDDGKLEK